MHVDGNDDGCNMIIVSNVDVIGVVVVSVVVPVVVVSGVVPVTVNVFDYIVVTVYDVVVLVLCVCVNIVVSM